MIKTTTLLQSFVLLLLTSLSINTHAGPVCGDGTVDMPNGEMPPFNEECDEGVMAASNLCTNDTVQGNGRCTFTICGDGIVQMPNGDPSFTGNEECDNGSADGPIMNSDTLPDACRTNCKAAFCGDNVVDTGEQCDDGGPSATCTANCMTIAPTTTTTTLAPTTTTTVAPTTTTTLAPTTTTTMATPTTTTTTVTPTTTTTTLVPPVGDDTDSDSDTDADNDSDSDSGSDSDSDKKDSRKKSDSDSDSDKKDSKKKSRKNRNKHD